MWNKDNMQALLDRNPTAVQRAIVLIYNNQTADEKSGEYTTHENGMGFSKFDAQFMTSLARQIEQGRGLSAKQLAIGRNKIKRYWRQLCEVANANEAKKAQPVEVEIPPAVDATPAEFGDWGNYEEAKMVAEELGDEVCHCNVEEFDGEPHYKREHFRFKNLHMATSDWRA